VAITGKALWQVRVASFWLWASFRVVGLQRRPPASLGSRWFLDFGCGVPLQHGASSRRRSMKKSSDLSASHFDGAARFHGAPGARDPIVDRMLPEPPELGRAASWSTGGS
jgi:hypothetical protein